MIQWPADTPLAQIDDIEFIHAVTVAHITMPTSIVRLSAGRESMSEGTQASAFDCAAAVRGWPRPKYGRVLIPIEVDPPQHADYRSLLTRFVKPKQMKRFVGETDPTRRRIT